MAVLKIVKSRNASVLREKAALVQNIDQHLLSLLKNMADTMYAASGEGLAAPQVGVSLRLAVVRYGGGVVELINPEIELSEGEQYAIESCLSLPGLFGRVKRPARLVVQAQDRFGASFKLDSTNRLACALSHEIDHLDGVLFIDKIE